MLSRISRRIRNQAKPVQQTKGLFDAPAVGAQTGAVQGATAGDDRPHSSDPHPAAIAVMVIATVGVQPLWPVSEAAHAPGGPCPATAATE
jgi:hypothetical protein